MSQLQESTNPDSKPAADTVLYIDWCARRWDPMVKHTDETRRGRTAYVLEREAEHLKAVTECAFASPAEKANLGARLKYVFPVIFRAMGHMAVDEIEFERVFAAMSLKFDEIFDEDNTGCCVRHETPPPEEKFKFISPLAERTHASYSSSSAPTERPGSPRRRSRTSTTRAAAPGARRG